MKTLLAIVVLLILAAAAYLYLGRPERQSELERAEHRVSRQAEQVKESIQDKLKDWHLTTPEIQKELERGGTIVRKKAQEVGSALKDATADARTTATIKAKLVKDPDLSALSISVSTTDGVVTLSGSVASAEHIRRAMELALDTEGVREVVSTLQTKAAR